jgi:thiamine-phosphate pyrophosphorylase
MLGVRLIAISDLSALPAPELVVRFRRLAALARPQTVALLLRDHAATGKQRLALGERLRDLAGEQTQQLWVADRADLALLLGADVLHLGEASVSARAVRSLLPGSMRISRAWHRATCHGAEPELTGVDALLVSPVLEPRKGRPALGLPALSALGEQLRARNQAYPLFALGGVSATNAAACLAAGASGVAAIGAVLAADPAPLLDSLGIRR